MSPNILPERDIHSRECLGMPFVNEPFAWAGDVRRCRHGRLQIAHDVPGYGSACWSDLSAVFNPVLYHRARKALSHDQPA